MDRIAILVAGMHRSGTSALTRMLNGLGCDLPATLMEADAYNAKGYWESTEVVALNEAVLASAGSAWDDWEPFNPDWHASPVAEGFRSRARAVIESEFGDSPLFVFKDPRVCRLLDFWIDALADCGVDARIALPIRNPLEVAASLEARDAIDPSVGLLLWLRHVLDAEHASRGHPRAFVRFDALLDNWQPMADAMGEAFGMAWPKRSTIAGIEIESGLVPTGRHHVRDDASLPSSAEVSRWVSETFAIVDRWTHSNARKADSSRLDALRSAFDEAAAVFGRAVATGMRAGQRNRVLGHEVTALNTVVSDREGQIDSLNRAVADRDENVGHLTGLVAKKDEQIASLDAVVEDRDRKVDALNHVVAGRDGQIAARDEQIASLDAVVEDRDRKVDALNHVVAGRDGQIAARDEQIASLDAVVEDRDRKVDALNHVVAGRDGQIAARDEQIASLDAVVEDRDRKVDALNHVVAGRDGQIAARDEQIASLDAAVEDRDRKVDALNHVVAGRDGQIAARDEQIDYLEGLAKAKDQELDAFGAVVADRDRKIDALQHVVKDRDGRIDSLRADVAERDGQIESLHGAVADRDGQIASVNQAVAGRDGQIDALHEVIEHRDEELAGVYGSYSWSLTKPLRVVKHALLTGPGVIGRGISRGGRHALGLVWRLTPLPKSWRDGLRRAGRRTLPSLAPPTGPAVHRTASTYVHSGWLDLADRNYEARRNGSGVAILFDPDWYCTTYPDIPAAEIDPLTHYLEHGAVEGRWPIELDPAEVDPTIQALHRLDCASEGAEAFDAGLCRVLYPELASLNDDELALVCRSESRTGSKAAFLRGICENPREIPLDFNASEYVRLYPDLRWLADQSPLEALRHYMCHGRFEPRLHTLRTDSMDAMSEAASVAELGARSSDAARPLCVLAHVYYPELWDELAGYLGNLPPDLYDLYVNLVDDTFDPELLARIRATFPAARIYVSENLGRDIGGHFQLLSNLRIEDYRLFCLVHTKKSPHMGEGEVQRWRRKLLVPLMGSPECATDNVQAMLEDETIGQIGSERCRYTEMNANREKYDALLERMEIASDSPEVEFLSGTMMFLRGDVLRRVFDAAGDLAFERSDEPMVEGDPDGAWAHAVERVFGAVVRDLNYRLEWR